MSAKADCLFCDNDSDSREHLWAQWIHKRIKSGPIRHQMWDRPARIVDASKQTVKAVCGECNNGWMSRLESEVIPLIGAMLGDLTIPLDASQQFLAAVWATKTAMISDSLKGHTPEKRFYERAECSALRVKRVIPDETRVWLGRYPEEGLGCIGTDFSIFSQQKERLAVGMATTIIVGHLALQVVSIHRDPAHLDKDITDLQPRAADWQELLVQIWPIELQYVEWPPRRTFGVGGQKGIASLMQRWRIGEKVSAAGTLQAE